MVSWAPSKTHSLTPEQWAIYTLLTGRNLEQDWANIIVGGGGEFGTTGFERFHFTIASAFFHLSPRWDAVAFRLLVSANPDGRKTLVLSAAKSDIKTEQMVTWNSDL